MKNDQSQSKTEVIHHRERIGKKCFKSLHEARVKCYFIATDSKGF
jgi:hypothetical protein